MPAHLITGGARSGKSAYAERLALQTELPTTYIATARPGDAEMQVRIACHRARRPVPWRTVECAVHLGAALREANAGCVIVDCLTLWLANLQPHQIEPERAALLDALPHHRSMLLIVTNELGSGVVPMGELARGFVDEHGVTNQRVAALCERVTLMVCGVPVRVKP